MTDSSAFVSARRGLVARRRLTRPLWFTGLVTLGVGLAIALEGNWLLAGIVVVAGAGLMWLVGAWVAPRSSDAYVRRLVRIWRQWASDTKAAHDEFTNTEASFVSRLRALSPPPEYVRDHERLVAQAEQMQQLRAKRTAAPQSQRAVADAAASSYALHRQLAERAAAHGHQAYASALDQLFAGCREAYARAAARSERATDDAIRQLARVEVPEAAAAEHDALRAAFQVHFVVARALHDASKAADGDRVAEAAESWAVSVRRLRACIRNAADKVGYLERWPDRRAAPQA